MYGFLILFSNAAATLCTTAISSLFSCKTLCEEKNLLVVVKKERRGRGRFLYVLLNYNRKTVSSFSVRLLSTLLVAIYD